MPADKIDDKSLLYYFLFHMMMLMQMNHFPY